jgi:hypothetical protein
VYRSACIRCLYYSRCVAALTISFRADEQTAAELRELAGGRNLSDAIRELIHEQYVARLYAQAAQDAERIRNDPADLAEIRAVKEELDEIRAW